MKKKSQGQSAPKRTPIGPSKRVPKLRHHKARDLAVVRLGGKDLYLGRWGSPEAESKYHRLIAEWTLNGRTLVNTDKDAPPTVAEICLAYLQHAQGHYLKDGELTSEYHLVVVAIRKLRPWDDVAGKDFGPASLRAVRDEMVNTGWARTTVNGAIRRIVRMFKWGAAHEWVPVTVYQTLAVVEPLRKGRTKAKDNPPVRPVDAAVVEATIPHLPEVVADMVRLQRLTGMRSGELCRMRPGDIDRSGEIWEYRDPDHKTSHHGHDRVVALGPMEQEILTKYLLRPAGAYCFSPAESEVKRRAKLHEERTTPLSCGNRPGTNKKRRPARAPKEQYDSGAYARAITRAIEKANEGRPKKEHLPHWHPHQLRHLRATEIRKQHGLEAVRVTLGHTSVSMSDHYAELDADLRRKIAKGDKEVG